MNSSSRFTLVALIAATSIFLSGSPPPKASLVSANVSIGGYCCSTPTTPDLFTNIITGTVPASFPIGDLKSVTSLTIIPASFDVTADQITETSDVNAVAASGSFNGPVYDFSGLSSPITDVTVDPLSTVIPVSVTFTGDSIAVNFAGETTFVGGSAILDVTTGGTVPEPSTWAMLLVGFAGLGYAGYRRGAFIRA
jgi:hypothetical protein